MKDTQTNLAFDQAVAREHINALVREYEDGQIEVCGFPAGCGGVVAPRHFPVAEIDAMVAHADTINARHGVGVYVGPARREGAPERGRAATSRGEVAGTRWVWIDCDAPGSAERVLAKLRNASFGPDLIVTTGTQPHLRQQLYIRLSEEIGANRARHLMDAMQRHLGGTDESTKNACRVMRLAGSVAWAKPDKPGRVDEMVTLDTTDEPPMGVHPETLEKAFKAVETNRATFNFDAGRTATGDDSEALLGLVRTRPNKLSRSDWVKLALALKHEIGDAARDDFLAFSARYAGGIAEGEAERVWGTAKPNGCAGGGSVVHLLGGFDKRESTAQGEARAAAPEPTRALPPGLINDRQGRPVWNLENAALLLETNTAWGDAFAWDEFNRRFMLMKPIPGSTMPATGFQAREVRENDFSWIVRWFNRAGFPMATKTVAVDAVYLVAEQTVISPVRHYLEDVRWDGTSRIDQLFSRYAGAEDNAYTREVGRRFLISAVARALKPGSKADHMPVLEGPQGVGKSTFLRILAGEDWFGDALPDMHSKDASSYLRGRWIVEVSEMAASNRSQMEAQKAFLSRQVETYRPPYGRVEVTEPRTCVFAGTTNRGDYLRDETGARRFWPVTVGTMDLAALEAARDQLWGEAVAAFRAGERWWLTPEVEALARVEQEERGEDDAWEPEVLGYCTGRDAVAVKDILSHRLRFEAEDIGRADTNRVAAILTRHGWRRNGRFTDPARKGLARFVHHSQPGR